MIERKSVSQRRGSESISIAASSANVSVTMVTVACFMTGSRQRGILLKTSSQPFIAGLITGAIAVLLGFLLGGWSQSPASAPASPRIIDALATRRLEVVDELGTVVAVFGSNKDGGSLSLKDRFGRTMVLAGAAESGGTIITNQAGTGGKSVVVGASKSGGSVAVFESSGSRVAELAGTASGGGLLEIHRPLDKGVAVRASASEAGGGLMETWSSRNQPLVRMGSSDGQQGQLTTFGPESVPLVLITSTQDQQGQIYTYDKNSQPLIALATNELGPALRIFNRTGQPVMTLESDQDGHGVLGIWKAAGEGRTLKP